MGSSALPFGSMGISTLSLPLTSMGSLDSSFLGASAGLPLGSAAGTLSSGFLGSAALAPLAASPGAAFGSGFFGSGAALGLGSVAGAFPSGFFSSGFLPAGSLGSVGAAALGGGAASLVSGFFSPGFSATVGFLPSAGGLGTSACFGSVALPFSSVCLGASLGGSFLGGGGGVVGGAGGTLGGSLGGSPGFFSAGAAALGAWGAWGAAGGFCSVEGGVPGAFAAVSGFLTSGVGVALFSGIEYLLHVSRNGKCVPSWDALGGLAAERKTILLTARIAAHIGHAVPLTGSNAR